MGRGLQPRHHGRLREVFAPAPVLTFDDCGWSSKAFEATAFALLARHAAWALHECSWGDGRTPSGGAWHRRARRRRYADHASRVSPLI